MPPFLLETLRSACVRLARLGLRLRSRPYLVRAGGILVVAPHADDETLGCGGLIAAKARAGQDVRVVFLTDSAGSHPGHPTLLPADLARLRRAEALAALQVLGVPAEHAEFFGLPDGSLGSAGAEGERALADRLAACLDRWHPAEILAPWRQDGSSEHAVAGRAAAAAQARSGRGTLLEYPVWAWRDPRRLRPRLPRAMANLRFRLGPFRAVKRAALQCHQSQVRPTPPWRQPVLPRSLARACSGPEEFFFL